MNNKKTLGLIILFAAILFLSPIPDPTDVISLQIYSSYSGADISPNNLSSIYMDYLIWSFVVGIVLLLVGMHLLGMSLNQLKRKLDLGKYKIALLIGVGVVFLIAYLDVQGLIFFTELGRDYTTGDFPYSYWIAFRNTAYILMGLVALCYWNFVKKDKSETLAVFLTPFILFWTGTQDLLYFILIKSPIPLRLEWLDSHIFIGWVSNQLGFDGVTNLSLIISVFIGAILVLALTKLLKEKF